MSQDMQKCARIPFLSQNTSLWTLINAITSVVNPTLYSAGLHAIQAIKQDDPDITWESVWSGFALIVNRETPYHRDSGGSLSMHDLLMSGGTHQDCYMEIAELGAEFSYLPGTIFALTGKALMHRVKTWAGGERICAAHFMRDAVLNRLGQARPSWPVLDHYL